MVKRQAPMKLKCLVDSCGTEFGGGTCWDYWMEHVGKHIETTAKVRVNKSVVKQQNDQLIID